MSGVAILAGVSIAAATALTIVMFSTPDAGRMLDRLMRRSARPTALAREVLREAFAVDEFPVAHAARRRRILICGLAAVLGYSLLGLPGAVGAAATAPWLRSRVARWRRVRTAVRIDEGCTELALALSSALAAGNSVRGALLAAGPALDGPIREEVDRLAVDITIGMSVEDSMAAMRDRTHSSRVEAVAGALALHRGSGGDLVLLMRELAAAFRGRDRAMRDARSASVQARYTAAVVAAIPIAAGALCELIAPGSIADTLSYLPTALMLVVAVSGVGAGVFASWRVGRG